MSDSIRREDVLIKLLDALIADAICFGELPDDVGTEFIKSEFKRLQASRAELLLGLGLTQSQTAKE